MHWTLISFKVELYWRQMGASQIEIDHNLGNVALYNYDNYFHCCDLSVPLYSTSVVVAVPPEESYTPIEFFSLLFDLKTCHQGFKISSSPDYWLECINAWIKYLWHFHGNLHFENFADKLHLVQLIMQAAFLGKYFEIMMGDSNDRRAGRGKFYTLLFIPSTTVTINTTRTLMKVIWEGSFWKILQLFAFKHSHLKCLSRHRYYLLCVFHFLRRHSL